MTARDRRSLAEHLGRWLAGLADLVSARPAAVVAVCVALALAAATQILNIEVSTSRTNLGHPANDAERDFGTFLKEYGSPNDLLAVIEAGPKTDAATLRRAADDLAAELSKDPQRIRSTSQKIDVDFFLRHILLFVPIEDIPQIRAALTSSYADDIRAGKVDGIDAVVDEITSAFAGRARAQQDAAGAAAGGAGFEPERVLPWLDTMTVMMRELEARLRDPSRGGFEGVRELIPPLKTGAIDDEGYFQSRDGRMRVVFITPSTRTDEVSVVRPIVLSVRETIRKVAARYPGLTMRLAGSPALLIDEMVIVDHDMFLSTVVSLLGITLILLYGYRKPQQVLLSLVPLLIGLLWTMALVRFTSGRINMVASIFLPILLGRGSDFAIYIIARFNAERGAGASPREAVRVALSASGSGVVTGALVTSAAFLVATLGQFNTFRQLGTIVGGGLVLVLISSLVVTPALLVLLGDKRMPGEAAAERLFEKLPSFGAGPGVLALRFPKVVLVGTAAALVVLAAQIDKVPYDFDLLKLLPRSAESVAAQLELSSRSDYGTDVVVVTTADVEEARAKAAQLAKLPRVGRVESVASFLPADQDRKLAELRNLRDVVASLPPFTEPRPATTPEKFAAALGKLSDEIDDKIFVTEQAVAGNPKLGPVAEALKRLAAQVNKCLEALKTMPPEAAQRGVSSVEHQIFTLLIRSRQLLRDNVLDAKKVEVKDLAEATRDRFLGQSGGSAVFVFPRQPGVGAEVAAFVEEVRTVAPRATGFPVVYHESTKSVKPSFKRAALQALLVIVLALLFHFRNAFAATLAAVPLAIAALSMFGLMHLFGMSHNMANIVSMPLLLGLGTDYGLQIVHHVRTHPDEPLRVVLGKTGLGVFMAGGTTAVGFGALTLGEHLGGFSLGLELLLGTTTAMVASLIVLPALLSVVLRDKKLG